MGSHWRAQAARPSATPDAFGALLVVACQDGSVGDEARKAVAARELLAALQASCAPAAVDDADR